jgi:hypothetical protein
MTSKCLLGTTIALGSSALLLTSLGPATAGMGIHVPPGIGVRALNPQPLPPGIYSPYHGSVGRALNPQPLPPGLRRADKHKDW